jgi:hypothetical protein
MYVEALVRVSSSSRRRCCVFGCQSAASARALPSEIDTACVFSGSRGTRLGQFYLHLPPSLSFQNMDLLRAAKEKASAAAAAVGSGFDAMKQSASKIVSSGAAPDESVPVSKFRTPKPNDGEIMTFSLDDLDDGFGAADGGSLVEEEAPDLDDDGIQWESVCWGTRIDEYHCRVLAVQVLALSTGWFAHDALDGLNITPIIVQSMGIKERALMQLLSAARLDGKKIPSTSAQSALDLSTLVAPKEFHFHRRKGFLAHKIDDGSDNVDASMLPPFTPLPIPEKETLKEKILREKTDRANKERWDQDIPQRLDELRAQKKLEAEMRIVQLQSTAGRSLSVLPFVQYQMYLLMVRRVEHFDNPETFKTWHERQCTIIASSLESLLDLVKDQSWTLEGSKKKVPSTQAIKAVNALIHELNSDFAGASWWRSCEEDYPNELEKMRHCIVTLAETASKASPSLLYAVEQLPFVFPIGLTLYERLLRLCFEIPSFELRPEFEEILDVIFHSRMGLAISHDLHDVAWAKMVFISATRFPSKSTFTLLSKGLSKVAAIASSPESSDHVVNATRAYARTVLKKVESGYKKSLERLAKCIVLMHRITTLRRYHTNFEASSSEGLEQALAIYFTVFSSGVCSSCPKPDQGSIADDVPASLLARRQEISRLVNLSISDSYHDMVSAMRPLAIHMIGDLINRLSQMLDCELEVYAPIMRPLNRFYMRESVHVVGTEFKKDLLVAVNSVETLNMEVARTLKRLKTFEKKLSEWSFDKVDGLSSSILDDSDLHELDLTKICRTMVTKWIVEQRAQFEPQIVKSVSLYRWEAARPPHTLHSEAAAKMFEMFNKTVDIFDQLAIPNSEPLMKPLLKGIADGIEIFVGLTKDGTDRCPEPIRPQPISKSAEKESVVELFDDESMAIYTNFEDSNELVVRLNSLDFAVVELHKLKDRAKQVSPDVDVGMFDVSIKSCQKAMSDIRKFIAHYSVAYEMMGPFLKALYTPSVEECYMPKNVLESFEPIIGNLYGFAMRMRLHASILTQYTGTSRSSRVSRPAL